MDCFHSVIEDSHSLIDMKEKKGNNNKGKKKRKKEAIELCIYTAI
jgi:hypothetical protein